MISLSAAQAWLTQNIKTPMLLRNLTSGTATQATIPRSRAAWCHGFASSELRMSLLMQGSCVRKAFPHMPVP